VTIYSWSEHAAFSQLPQILCGFGFKGVLMRTHFLMYGYCPGYDLPVAWWQSPDGSRLPCVPTYVHQERLVPSHRAHPPGPFGLTTEDTWILTRYPSPESSQSLDSFRNRFAHIQPLVASRIDDSGLKREALVSELDGRDDYRWATLEQLFGELPAPTKTIAPSAEEFGTRIPWGYRGNELFDLNRRGETAVLTAERLLARILASPKGLAFDPASRALTPEQVRGYELTLQQAWKDLLVGQHHDIQIVSRAGPMGRERLSASLEQSRKVLRDLLHARVADDGANAADGFVVFNPLAWPRTEGYAELPDGTEVEGSVSVPSLGFSSFSSSTAPLVPFDGLSFATDHYDVKFSTNGGITALCWHEGKPVLRTDLFSGRLVGVIDGQACEGLGAVTVHRGPAGFQVEDRGKIGPLPYSIRWFFPQNGRRVECRINVQFDGQRIGAPTSQRNDSRSCFLHEQKLRLRVFPAMNPGSAFGIRDVPFGISRTDQPYIEGIYWTALSDGNTGLAIANRGTMGTVREADGGLSVPLAFATDYVWGAEILSGRREWALALIPWEGDWQAAELPRRGLEFAFPLVAVPGRLAARSPDFLRLDSPGLILTALYVEGGHGFARLFNGTGGAQAIVWKLPDQSTPTPVDLKDRDLAGGISTELRAWQFETFRVW
jgi:hypothetical protein